ncbi:hypothetical protein ACFOTA_18140 [Chitinophaga sp. GCM10012297]|uniref:Uncharacterized protein n=1 Tax=Chitinophaga chungangae TaxID=2821488 RepID=A0ABS3YHH6_9BACT|nr:hypothetical protein [Chitinophaga chungangae]MBO9154141.1 hypothetical protein [Chitinophaga chungangae]
MNWAAWYEFARSSDGAASEYIKNINPGTILRLDCYTATLPTTTGVSYLMPLHYTFEIPIRYVGLRYGTLKSYERDFLLAYLATNIKKKFPEGIPEDKSLVHLWNYLMRHLVLVQDAKKTSPAKVKVEYKDLRELFDSIPAFRECLAFQEGEQQDLIVPRSIETTESIKDFFQGSLSGHVATKSFYKTNLSDRYFSYVSYTVIVDDVSYDKHQATRELSTWSVYDWVNSGIPVYEEEKQLRFIVFKKHHGRYSINYNGEEAGRTVRYQQYPQNMLSGSGRNKSISEEDLTSIFPNAVKRLVYKKPHE